VRYGDEKISQISRHLLSNAHEWINEIPTVPIYDLAKPLPREREWKNAAIQVDSRLARTRGIRLSN